jgi:hypothetical protein
MYILYADESGHCGKKFNPHQPIELMAGVLTDFTKLFKTQKEQRYLTSIIREINVDMSELKAQEIYGGRNGWEKITPQRRDNIFETILEWINDRQCKLFICPIDSNKFFNLKASKDLFAEKFQFPYETAALNLICGIQRLKNGTKNNKGKTVVVFDEQQDHDKNIMSTFESDLEYTDGYTGFKPKPRAKQPPERFDQIVDIPFFSKSHLAIMTQLADIVAFVSAKDILMNYYAVPEKYPGEAEKISKWSTKIKSCMVHHLNIDPNGKSDLERFFKRVRPDNWTAKTWIENQNNEIIEPDRIKII